MRHHRLLLALALPAILVLAACSGSGGSSVVRAATAAPSAAPLGSLPTVRRSLGGAVGGSTSASTPLAARRSCSSTVTRAGSGPRPYARGRAGTRPATTSAPRTRRPSRQGTAAAGKGLDASLLTAVDRTNGTKQPKYGDWPLYYFAADKAAGDTNGQDIGTTGTSSGPTAN